MIWLLAHPKSGQGHCLSQFDAKPKIKNEGSASLKISLEAFLWMDFMISAKEWLYTVFHHFCFLIDRILDKNPNFLMTFPVDICVSQTCNIPSRKICFLVWILLSWVDLAFLYLHAHSLIFLIFGHQCFVLLTYCNQEKYFYVEYTILEIVQALLLLYNALFWNRD